MNPLNFCYWLRGVLEVCKPNGLTKEQLEIISKHLDLVLTPVLHIQTMPYTPPPTMPLTYPGIIDWTLPQTIC